jgi:hypothetical protein
LAWDCMKPDRELPWYFATYDSEYTHCYGVKTGFILVNSIHIK